MAGAAAVIPEPNSFRIEIGDDVPLSVSQSDDAAYPLGTAPAISVELSEPTTSPDLAAEYVDGADPVERDVVLDLFGEEVEVGSINYPTDWAPFADANGPGEYTLRCGVDFGGPSRCRRRHQGLVLRARRPIAPRGGLGAGRGRGRA